MIVEDGYRPKYLQVTDGALVQPLFTGIALSSALSCIAGGKGLAASAAPFHQRPANRHLVICLKVQ